MTRRLIPDVVEGQRLPNLPETATVRGRRSMARRNVRSVLVTRGSKLIGIFTGTRLDFLGYEIEVLERREKIATV
jgi:hypothetical protein